ncbi:MAG: cadherin repeat domain-containing protein [Nitrospira sp.]|nr:MAG: cadherin repeat domain-containing protein [Nitrospira sp.]
MITVADGSSLNYEAAASHSLTVQVTDSGGQSYTESFTINLTNVNEAPIITSNDGGAAAAVNVAENQNTVTIVAAMDVDTGTTLTYGIAGGPDAARFSIDSATGALRFSTAPNFELSSDVGRDNVYDVTVQVSDSHGGTATQSISVRVTDVNEAPRITSNQGGDIASVTIRENNASVTRVRAIDQDQGARVTYSVVGGADAAQFTINPNTGVLHLNSTPNFEQPTDTDRNNTYQVVVQASDGRGGIDSQAITVRVTNINEAPTDLSLSASTIAENATTGTVVGTVTGSDVDAGDTKTYSLTDTAGGRFAINSATGRLTVADGSLLDYESAANHTVTVQVMDSGGQSYTEQFTINLTNVNEGPTDLALSANTVAESAVTGTVVGAVTGTDPDASDTKTYSLTDTAGGRFAIDASTGVITVADGSLLNYVAAASHNLTVQVTDSGGQSYTEQFTINLTNVNEGPIATTVADEFSEDMAHRLATANFGIRDSNVFTNASLPGINLSNESEEDRFRLPDNPRNVIDIKTEGPLPIEILTPDHTDPSVVSAPVEKALAEHKAERLPNLGEKREPDAMGYQTDSQNTATAKAEPKEFLKPDDPIENVEESTALKLSATIGLAGVVLQNGLGNNTKLSRLISRPAGASKVSPETTTQQSPVDDRASNQDKLEHPRSAAADADQT